MISIMRFAQNRLVPLSSMAADLCPPRTCPRGGLRLGPILELIGVGAMMAAFMALAMF